MTRENTSIQTLLAAAEQSIPNLDGHNIRVAERRILWSKLAQTPAPQPQMPPTVTPEQVAAWNQPKTYEEWEEAQKYKQPASNQQIMDQQAWQQANPEDALGQLLRPQGRPAPQQGMAHVPPQSARRPRVGVTRVIELPEMTIYPETTIELPEMEIKSSKNVNGLIRVANYLNKKAAGQTFEQAQAAYVNTGGDTLYAEKGKAGVPDVSQKQYETILNNGQSYLPIESENLAIEIRAAIQNGKAVGVTVLTNPANPKVAGLIDVAVRRLVFPTNPKMDFVITKF